MVLAPTYLPAKAVYISHQACKCYPTRCVFSQRRRLAEYNKAGRIPHPAPLLRMAGTLLVVLNACAPLSHTTDHLTQRYHAAALFHYQLVKELAIIFLVVSSSFIAVAHHISVNNSISSDYNCYLIILFRDNSHHKANKQSNKYRQQNPPIECIICFHCSLSNLLCWAIELAFVISWFILSIDYSSFGLNCVTSIIAARRPSGKD